jgi:hypothetical protein
MALALDLHRICGKEKSLQVACLANFQAGLGAVRHQAV